MIGVSCLDAHVAQYVQTLLGHYQHLLLLDLKRLPSNLAGCHQVSPRLNAHEAVIGGDQHHLERLVGSIEVLELRVMGTVLVGNPSKGGEVSLDGTEGYVGTIVIVAIIVVPPAWR